MTKEAGQDCEHDVTHFKVIKPQTGHYVALKDPNIQPKWKPYFVEEIREALDFIRN